MSSRTRALRPVTRRRDDVASDDGQRLEALWQQSQDAPVTSVPDEHADLIRRLLNSSSVYARWAVVTQIAARYLSGGTVSATAIQKAAGFDARTLCHKYVVPLNQATGEPLGRSTEPYLGKPLRTPQFIDTPEITDARRNKDEWRDLCVLLAAVDLAPAAVVEQYLFIAFQEMRVLAVRRTAEMRQLKTVVTDAYRSANEVTAILDEYMTARTGGRRVQIVAAAVLTTFAEITTIFDEVRTYRTNASDVATSNFLDVDCMLTDEVVWSVETKDRDLSTEYLVSKVRAICARPHNRDGELTLIFLAKELPPYAVREAVFREARDYQVDCRFALYDEWLRATIIYFDVRKRERLLLTLGELLAEHGEQTDVSDLKNLLVDPLAA